jgi:hypothetical protein
MAALLGLIAAGYAGLWADAKEEQDKMPKPEYHDIYLTDNRVCRTCTGVWIGKERVQLTNRQGERILVNATDIVGVDRHPFARKLLTKSLYGIGLSGAVIVPYAFDDWQDYICKYCPDRAIAH